MSRRARSRTPQTPERPNDELAADASDEDIPWSAGDAAAGGVGGRFLAVSGPLRDDPHRLAGLAVGAAFDHVNVTV
jgi:hypothetical protein